MSQNNINSNIFNFGNADDENLAHSFSADIHENTFSNNITLKNEIKNIETSLNIHMLPQFNDILNYFQQANNLSLYRTCMNNLLKIIQIKEKDNEVKVEYLNKLTRLEQDRQNLEVALGKYKNQIVELVEKQKKSDQILIDKKKKWKDIKQKLFNELEQESKLNQKIKLREAQYLNDMKKKDNLVFKQNEQIKRLLSMDKPGSSSQTKDFSFLSSVPRTEMNISYTLSKNQISGINSNNNIMSNNLSSNNSNNNPARLLFLEDLQKNLDNKYSNIIKENNLIKSFLHDIHFKLINLVDIKKEVFLDNYKKTFGTEFLNDNNVEMNAEVNNPGLSFLQEKVNFNTNFDLSMEIQPFVNTFNSNFTKLKEYLTKNDELSYINNFMDGPSSKKSDVNSYLTDKYVSNLSAILENYKLVNNKLVCMLNQAFIIKQSKEENPFNELLSKLENFDINQMNISHNLQHIRNIKDGVNENNSILQTYTNDNFSLSNQVNQEIINIRESERINIGSLTKFNNSLKEEIEGYENIISNALEFCRK